MSELNAPVWVAKVPEALDMTGIFVLAAKPHEQASSLQRTSGENSIGVGRLRLEV